MIVEFQDDELELVKFAVKSDLEILSNSIKDSDATEEWKREYTILRRAYEKLV